MPEFTRGNTVVLFLTGRYYIIKSNTDFAFASKWQF